MAPPNRDVLISGASVAGPVLAHWLRHYGFNPTLVEHTPSVRTGLGSHAVDLFGASVDVVERTGRTPTGPGARTRTELILFERDGQPPIALNMGEVATGMSIRHVEILRGELTKILSGAASDGVGYLSGTRSGDWTRRRRCQRHVRDRRPAPVRPRGRGRRAALERPAAGLRRRGPVHEVHRRLLRGVHVAQLSGTRRPDGRL